MSGLAVAACVAIPIALSYRRGGALQVKDQHFNVAGDLHWRRRLQHAACGLAVTASYQWLVTESNNVVTVIVISCSGLVVLHGLRSHHKAVNDAYIRLMAPLLRPHEVHGLPGAFWFLLGAAVAVALFPKPVALQSILHLSLGDPAASLVGISLGSSSRVLARGKSIAGLMAAFVACTLASLSLFLSLLGPGQRGPVIILAGMGGVSGALGEALPLGMDDNFSMPVVSGLLFLMLHWCWTGSPELIVD
ncbi:unnamed protein product [Discosporangium mesarthrocarpum]